MFAVRGDRREGALRGEGKGRPRGVGVLAPPKPGRAIRRAELFTHRSRGSGSSNSGARGDEPLPDGRGTGPGGGSIRAGGSAVSGTQHVLHRGREPPGGGRVDGHDRWATRARAVDERAVGSSAIPSTLRGIDPVLLGRQRFRRRVERLNGGLRGPAGWTARYGIVGLLVRGDGERDPDRGRDQEGREWGPAAGPGVTGREEGGQDASGRRLRRGIARLSGAARGTVATAAIARRLVLERGVH